MHFRLFPSLALVIAGGSRPTVATTPSAATPMVKKSAPSRVLVLAGEHAFAGAIWLPSGALLAHSQHELWLISLANPEHARILPFPEVITRVAGNEHDDLVAVGTADGTVTVVRDLQVLRTVPGAENDGAPRFQLSPDGKLLARIVHRGDDHTELVDPASGQIVRSLPIVNGVLFDPSTRYVTDGEALFDLAGRQRFMLASKARERLHLRGWAGYSFGWVRRRMVYAFDSVLHLVDPETGKSRTMDVACRSREDPVSEIIHRGRYLRTCGDRLMLVDGEAGTLHRIDLPASTTQLPGLRSVSPRGENYVVHLDGERVALLDTATYELLPTPHESWHHYDDREPSLRHGSHWVEVRDGTVTVRTLDADAIVVRWGAVLSDTSERVAPSYRHRARAGAIEVTNHSTAAFVQRFGAPLALSPPTPPSRCEKTRSWSGTHPLGGVELWPVSDRPDMACVCTDSECDTRSLLEGYEIVAATLDATLYMPRREVRPYVIVRIGKDGLRSEVSIDNGNCFSGALTTDRRAFVTCVLDGAFNRKLGRTADSVEMQCK